MSLNIPLQQWNWALSKRTTVYAYGADGKNMAYLKNLTAKELGVGMSHRFCGANPPQKQMSLILYLLMYSGQKQVNQPDPGCD